MAYRSLRFGWRLSFACGSLGFLLLLMLSKWGWALVIFVLGFGGGILSYLAMERIRKAQWRVVERQIIELSPLVEKVAHQYAQNQGAEVRELEFHNNSVSPYQWRWWQGKVGQSRKYRVTVQLDMNYNDVLHHDKEPIVSGYVVSRVAYRPYVPSLPLPQDENWWSISWDGPFEPSKKMRTGDLVAESLLAALIEMNGAVKT